MLKKSTLMALVLALLLGTAVTGQAGEVQAYENETHGIRFSHPADWLPFTPEMLAETFLESDEPMDSETLAAMFPNVVAIFYPTESMMAMVEGGATADLTVQAIPLGDASVETPLTEADAAQMKASQESIVEAAGGALSWEMEPTLTESGVITYLVNTSVGGVEAASYSAALAENGRFYMLTYTAESIDSATRESLDALVASVETF